MSRRCLPQTEARTTSIAWPAHFIYPELHNTKIYTTYSGCKTTNRHVCVPCARMAVVRNRKPSPVSLPSPFQTSTQLLNSYPLPFQKCTQLDSEGIHLCYTDCTIMNTRPSIISTGTKQFLIYIYVCTVAERHWNAYTKRSLLSLKILLSVLCATKLPLRSLN